MGNQMVTALMLTKSWDAVHREYGTPEGEKTPAHIEEGIADLDDREVMLEKEALRYDADFLRRMVPVTQDAVQGLEDSDSDTECDMDTGGSDEVDEGLTSDLAYSGSHNSSPLHSFVGPSVAAFPNAFQQSLLREQQVTPSPSTPHRGEKRRASPSVSLTPSMASRFQKKLRPNKRRNYKV